MIRELVERMIEDLHFKNLCYQGKVSINGISKKEIKMIVETLNNPIKISKSGIWEG